MLDVLLSGDPAGLVDAREAALASRGRGDRGLVARAEDVVAADPDRAIAFAPDGTATIHAAGRRFDGGRFATRSIGELRALATACRESVRPGATRGRLSVILGADPLTDIGTLQATAEPGTLFQVASQFNCLESPGPYLVPIRQYLTDPTQGPRAAVSAFPGTLVRHYAAPGVDGRRFVQGTDRQIDLLADALPLDLGRVRGGYLTAGDLNDIAAAAGALEANFDAIRVGVHDGIEVVLGHAWDGAVTGDRRIAQVFTSTLAGSGYSGGARIAGPLEAVCRQLLRAAYLGTLLAAAALGSRRVVLTLIGGGVFGNPHPLVWEAILWAFDRAAGSAGELDVVVNARGLSPSLPIAQVVDDVHARKGVVATVAR